jgi:hypothetical protein
MEGVRTRTFIIYGVELAIAAILLWYDQRLFFLYFFLCLLAVVDTRYVYLKKLIAACETLDRLRFKVIIKKLNVTEEEITQAREEAMNELGRVGEMQLVKLLREVGLKE